VQVGCDKGSLFVVAQVLDFVVVVVKQAAQIELVVILGLELYGVTLFCALLPEDHLVLVGVVVHGDGVAHVVAEGVDGVVLG